MEIVPTLFRISGMWKGDNRILFQTDLWLPWFREKILLLSGARHRAELLFGFPLVKSQVRWLTLFKIAVNTLFKVAVNTPPVHLWRMSEFPVERVHWAVHRNTGVVLWRNVRWCLHTCIHQYCNFSSSFRACTKETALFSADGLLSGNILC